MLGTDYSWVTEQLDLMGYSEDIPENVKTRNAVIELFHTLDASDPKNDSERNVIVELFNALALARQIAPREALGVGATWQDFIVGETRPGATVRVRRDAYEGAGARYNGLIGTVVAVRGGRVYVQYTGRNDSIGHSHHPDMIQVLVK